MSRRNVPSRRLAWVALGLALLVPTRAAALCCLAPVADLSHVRAAHDAVHHETASADPASARGAHAELASAPVDDDCATMTSAAPALRERGSGGDPVSASVACSNPLTALGSARVPPVPRGSPRAFLTSPLSLPLRI